MKTYYYGRDINSGKIVEFEKPVEGVAGDMCICLNEDGGWHVVKLEDDIKVDDNTFLQITEAVEFCEGAAALCKKKEKKEDLEKKMDEYIADMDREALYAVVAAYDKEDFGKVWEEYVKLDN